MTVDNGQVKLPHVVSMEELTTEEVMGLIQRGLAFKNGQAQPNAVSHLVAANLFFEDSTRTHKSFEMAEIKLGMERIDFNASTSSVNKGETLYDTILTMSALGVEVCVIRHPAVDYYRELIDSPTIKPAIVNGGDGSGQHPSQSLLDLMTIYEEFGSFTGLKVLIAGDLRHSRVARSNMDILHRLGAQLFFSGPKEWYDPAFDVYGRFVDLDQVIEELDVLMLLRVQHERHDGATSFSKEAYHQTFGLTENRYKLLKPGAIIMHPAPVNRGVEIADQLVEAEKSRITAQMENGVYVRMAILEAVLADRA